MTQLVELQKSYGDIQAEGVEVLVVIPDTQAANRQTAQQIKSAFALLSDTDQEAISAYNAADALHLDTVRLQTYLIDENGVIVRKTLMPSEACE